MNFPSMLSTFQGLTYLTSFNSTANQGRNPFSKKIKESPTISKLMWLRIPLLLTWLTNLPGLSSSLAYNSGIRIMLMPMGLPHGWFSNSWVIFIGLKWLGQEKFRFLWPLKNHLLYFWVYKISKLSLFRASQQLMSKISPFSVLS